MLVEPVIVAVNDAAHRRARLEVHIPQGFVELLRPALAKVSRKQAREVSRIHVGGGDFEVGWIAVFSVPGSELTLA